MIPVYHITPRGQWQKILEEYVQVYRVTCYYITQTNCCMFGTLAKSKITQTAKSPTANLNLADHNLNLHISSHYSKKKNKIK